MLILTFLSFFQVKIVCPKILSNRDYDLKISFQFWCCFSKKKLTYSQYGGEFSEYIEKKFPQKETDANKRVPVPVFKLFVDNYLKTKHKKVIFHGWTEIFEPKSCKIIQEFECLREYKCLYHIIQFCIVFVRHIITK